MAVAPIKMCTRSILIVVHKRNNDLISSGVRFRLPVYKIISNCKIKVIFSIIQGMITDNQVQFLQTLKSKSHRCIWANGILLFVPKISFVEEEY